MAFESKINISLIYNFASFTIAISWVYHGLVPKLLYMETGELEMLNVSGLFPGHEEIAVRIIGIAEILFGIAFILRGRSSLLHYLNITALFILAMAALIIKESVYLDPFNPATTSLGMMALSGIVLIMNRKDPNR